MVESELKKTLINARKKLNLTHEDVANLANITRQYYGMIENGKRNPSVNKVKLIAETLDIDWTIFLVVRATKRCSSSLNNKLTK